MACRRCKAEIPAGAGIESAGGALCDACHARRVELGLGETAAPGWDSWGFGFAVGVVGGLFGLLVIWFLTKGKKGHQGAVWGFFLQMLFWPLVYIAWRVLQT